VTPEDFARKVKEVLNAPFVQLGNAGKPVERVALLGGSGDSNIGGAISAGADTYVSGALGYHSLTDAREMGINLIEAGHFYTEDHVCEVLKNMISSIDETIVCDVRSSTNITVL
jgi:putative NIF3 family GTP cyclohydrolase 1 type 2